MLDLTLADVHEILVQNYGVSGRKAASFLSHLGRFLTREARFRDSWMRQQLKNDQLRTALEAEGWSSGFHIKRDLWHLAVTEALPTLSGRHLERAERLIRRRNHV